MSADAGKRPKGEAGSGKPAIRGPVRGAAPARPAKPAEEPEEEGEGAAVDLASAPSSSSGRERPQDAEDGDEEAAADESPAPEERAPSPGGSGRLRRGGAKRVTVVARDPAEGDGHGAGSADETVETEAPTRPKRTSGRREKPERKAKTERNPAVKTAKAGAGQSRRARAEADDGADGESGSRDGRGGDKGFQRGISLGVKISVFTALLVAISMAVLGWNLGATALREIDDQINEKGVAAAKAFAFQPKEIIFEKSGGSRSALRDAEIDAWQKSLAAIVAKEPMFLNIMYFHDERGKVLMSSDAGVRLAADPSAVGDTVDTAEMPQSPKDGVGIQEGQYSGKVEGGFTGRIRKYVAKVSPVKFTAPVIKKEDDDTGGGAGGNRGGGMFGGPGAAPGVAGAAGGGASGPLEDAWVHVLMKADEVDRVAEAVKQKILVLCLVGTGIAILLSIVMATFLAAPLRALVDDMHVVAEGKLDHKTVPRSADEIGLAAYQFNEMTKSLRSAQKLEHERQAIENELSIATEIQTKLLPDRIPQIPGIDLFSFYLSAKEVGGDYYDFLVIDPTHLGLIVADVSGKGIPGAMVMTMVRSLLRLASHREISPAETLKKVNRILAKDIRRGMFVTAIYAVLDVQRKRLTVASAGHNPMVYYEAATKTVRAVNPSGIALGFDKGRTFDENIREETLDLKTGDRCVVYTDGVVEAMSEKQEEFGMERFMELVKEQAERSSKDFTNGVVEELEGHRGRGEQSDDITITTLRVE